MNGFLNKCLTEENYKFAYNVNETDYKCPCCGSNLFIISSRMLMVFDGNTIYYCEDTNDHKFWRNSRETGEVLHQNKNASETNWHSDQDWELVNDTWIKVDDNE